MLPKKRIEVREGIFNALAEKKGYLENWDDYLLRLANGQSKGGENHEPTT